MTVGGISIWQLIIAVIVILLFGTKHRGMGGDLGSAVKGSFKKAMSVKNKPADKKMQTLNQRILNSRRKKLALKQLLKQRKKDKEQA